MKMEERARSCLLRSKATLEQDIKASYLMDHMISDGVLTGDEEERILRKVCQMDTDIDYTYMSQLLVKLGNKSLKLCFLSRLCIVVTFHLLVFSHHRVEVNYLIVTI